MNVGSNRCSIAFSFGNARDFPLRSYRTRSQGSAGQDRRDDQKCLPKQADGLAPRSTTERSEIPANRGPIRAHGRATMMKNVSARPSHLSVGRGERSSCRLCSPPGGRLRTPVPEQSAVAATYSVQRSSGGFRPTDLPAQLPFVNNPTPT